MRPTPHESGYCLWSARMSEWKREYSNFYLFSIIMSSIYIIIQYVLISYQFLKMIWDEKCRTKYLFSYDFRIISPNHDSHIELYAWATLHFVTIWLLTTFASCMYISSIEIMTLMTKLKFYTLRKNVIFHVRLKIVEERLPLSNCIFLEMKHV